jgi:hypothetical protein
LSAEKGIKNMKTLNIISSLALTLAMGIWSPVRAQTTEPAEKKMTQAKMMERCQEM